MKQDWRLNQVALLDQAKKVLAQFDGELTSEYDLGSGMRGDFLLETNEARYMVEVNGSSTGEYASFATWGQMTMY